MVGAEASAPPAEATLRNYPIVALVERALVSVLEEQFPTGSIQEGILIADEFHMMSDDQKEELIAWIIPRLNWMKVSPQPLP